jgi:hypothetical protein
VLQADDVSLPESEITSEVLTPLDGASDEDLPLDEALSDSMRPILPPAPSLPPPHSMKTAYDTVITDSEPPPSLRAHDSTGTQSFSSVGEHLARARRIGTRIWYAGVFLWTYLVVGELVVGVGLPEAFGWSAFAGVVVGTFLHGANRIGTGEMGKSAAISVGSVIACVFVFATLVGSSRRTEYQVLSLVLLLASIGLIFWGRHYSRGGLPQTLRKPTKNGLRILLWVLFLGHTALVGAIFLN